MSLVTSVRGNCATHGLWTNEVPTEFASRYKDRCPECEVAVMPQPVKFEMVQMVGSCGVHGPWARSVPKMLAGRNDGRCPHCDDELLAKPDTELQRIQAVAKMGKRAGRMQTLAENSGIPKRFQGRTFANYRAQVGEPQESALDKVRKFAEFFPKVVEMGASLVLCGKPGTGKTHLACAAGNYVIQHHGASVRFTTVFEIVQLVKETYGSPDLSERKVMLEFVKPDLLIIDEVGVQFGTEFEKVVITDIINRRYNDMLPVIIMSNLTAKELGQYLGERVMDRAHEGGGGVLAFDWNSYRDKVARDRDLPRGSYQAPEWLNGD